MGNVIQLKFKKPVGPHAQTPKEFFESCEHEWSELKEEIDILKGYAYSDDNARRKLNVKKDRASVLKFAMEAFRRGEDLKKIIKKMEEDTNWYATKGNYRY